MHWSNTHSQGWKPLPGLLVVSLLISLAWAHHLYTAPAQSIKIVCFPTSEGSGSFLFFSQDTLKHICLSYESKVIIYFVTQIRTLQMVTGDELNKIPGRLPWELGLRCVRRSLQCPQPVFWHTFCSPSPKYRSGSHRMPPPSFWK